MIKLQNSRAHICDIGASFCTVAECGHVSSIFIYVSVFSDVNDDTVKLSD